MAGINTTTETGESDDSGEVVVVYGSAKKRHFNNFTRESTGNANAYNLYFYSAIMADIASAVADSTCGPGRNLMVGSTYWVFIRGSPVRAIIP